MRPNQAAIVALSALSFWPTPFAKSRKAKQHDVGERQPAAADIRCRSSCRQAISAFS